MDTWTAIATFLDIKDLAKLASTCRALAGLQPHALWTVRLDSAGQLGFASGHWRAAKALRLSFSERATRLDEEEYGELVGAITESIGRVHSLEQLEVHCSRYHDEPAVGVWLGPLLARSPALQLLDIRTIKVLTLPLLRNLLHLRLAVDEEISDAALAGIMQATALTALHLECSPLDAKFDFVVLDIGSLDLAMLLNLRHLRLNNIRPEQLAVPKACAVHVKGPSLACERVVGLVPGNVATVNLSGDFWVHNAEEVARIRQVAGMRCDQLTVLRLTFRDYSAPDGPIVVQGALLRSVYVYSNENLAITIGPDVQLRDMTLRVMQKLCLEVVDARKAVSKLESLWASFKRRRGRGFCALKAAMQQRGLDVTLSAPDAKSFLLGSMLFPQDASWSEPDFLCMACPSCLHKTGAHPYYTVPKACKH